MKKYLIIHFVTLSLSAISQNEPNKKWTFSGYGEIYYSYDFSKPEKHEKPSFIYNHKRHNEINANLLLVKASYNDNSLRANAGLMAGTYAQYNLASEPTFAQFIYEANIGFKISKKQNLWIDAGIMPSHIGFEGAIGADNWTLTRSLMAENSPYYETGIKLSVIDKKEKLNLAFLLLNGWQRIRRVEGNQKPSIGMQMNFKPNAQITLNYSNFLGSDKPDMTDALRIFHNFYAIYEPNEKIGLIAGFDIGSEKRDNKFYSWYSPNLILRTKLTDKSKLAFRAEYYQDRNQIIIGTSTQNGFDVLGFSSNLDFQIHPKGLFRIEAKSYHSKDPIFYDSSNQNFSITTTLIARF